MANDKEIALYYPYIDIDDASFIKTAALYWDEIQTIVPFDGQEHYKTEISKEARESGLLKPRFVDPNDNAVNKTSREFALDIRNTKTKQRIADVIKKYIRSRRQERPKFSTIHFDKFNTTHLLHIGFELKEVGIDITFDEEQIIVPTPFFDTYMTRLGASISEADGSIPVTNVSDWHNILIDRYVNYTEERKENQAQLAIMSLQTISINRRVPLIKILNFRDHHGEELINFRRQIRELSRQIATGLNTAERQSVFEEIIQDKILPAKGEIEAKLNESNIAFGFSCFDIAQASIMGFICSGGRSWLRGIAGGIISLGISLTKGLREDRNISKDHPLGYLYKAQQQLGEAN